jgi:quercetin dioxygenase-like cupin family protein
MARKQIWDGVAGRLVEGDQLTVGVVELEPSGLVPEHRHANEQAGLVLEGSVRMTVGEESADLGPGGTYRIASGVPHTLTAGPEGAVVVDIFAPRRDDWSALPALPDAPPRWPPRSSWPARSSRPA